MRKERKPINIDEICSNDECHCERGILYSSLHHTLTVGSFILLVTLILNTLYLFVGGEAIASVLYDRPVISHVLAAVLGLIPNCAVSVLFTQLYIGGAITVGTMLSGLFSGAGIGLLVAMTCQILSRSGREEQALLAHYRTLGKIREENRALFAGGEFAVLYADGGFIAYSRKNNENEICVLANASLEDASYALDGEWCDLLSDERYCGVVAAQSVMILKRQ